MVKEVWATIQLVGGGDDGIYDLYPRYVEAGFPGTLEFAVGHVHPGFVPDVLLLYLPDGFAFREPTPERQARMNLYQRHRLLTHAGHPLSAKVRAWASLDARLDAIDRLLLARGIDPGLYLGSAKHDDDRPLHSPAELRAYQDYELILVRELARLCERRGRRLRVVHDALAISERDDEMHRIVNRERDWGIEVGGEPRFRTGSWPLAARTVVAHGHARVMEESARWPGFASDAEHMRDAGMNWWYFGTGNPTADEVQFAAAREAFRAGYSVNLGVHMLRGRSRADLTGEPATH